MEFENYTWREQLRGAGIEHSGTQATEYNLMGSSHRIERYSSSNPVGADVQTARKATLDFMNSNGLNSMGPTSIMRGVSAGSFFNSYPQYALEQFVGTGGSRGLVDGMVVFGFDIENLGSLPGKGTGMFAPTELAIKGYRFNSTNPERYNAYVGKRGKRYVKRYFEPLDDGFNLVRALDKTEEDYYENILKSLESGVNKASMLDEHHTRSLADLMKYADGAVFDGNGGIKSHNPITTHRTSLTKADIDTIRQGMRNLKNHGVQSEEFVKRANDYVERHAKSSVNNAFKVMAYNGTMHDVPGLKYKFGDQLYLVNGTPTSRYTGNIDFYESLNSLFSNPNRKIYGDGVGVKGQMTLQQANVASHLFGFDTTQAHAAIYDIGMQESIANYLMADIDNAYYKNGKKGIRAAGALNPINMKSMKSGIRMATYDPAYLDINDRLYARSGVGGGADSVFDMVFRFNDNKFEHATSYTASVFSSRTYLMKGMFDVNNNGQRLYGMTLYNQDDDLYHVIMRDDPRKLQNLIHEKFSYLGGTVPNIQDTKELVRAYSDSARRRYMDFFTPSTSNMAGDSFSMLKNYLDANRKLNGAISSGAILESQVTQSGGGLISRANISKVAATTNMSEANARNLLYVRGRLSSEADALQPFVAQLDAMLQAGQITGGDADLALYNFKKEMDAQGRHVERIQPKAGAGQMFVYDGVTNEYKLVDTSNVERMSLALNNIVKQGKDPLQHKRNAHQIINDLSGRGHINNGQADRLHKIISKMDATEVEDARTVQFMRDIAAEVLDSNYGSQASLDDYIKRVSKEFDIAISTEKAYDIAGGDASSLFFAERVKGGIGANYQQESMKMRKFDGGVLDRLRNNSVVDSVIEQAKKAFNGTKLTGGFMTWDTDALEYFSKYDQHTKARLRSISNLDAGIDFAKGYKGIASELDSIARAYVNADPEHSLAVSTFMDGKHQSLIMAMYAKKDAAQVLKDGKIVRGHKNVVEFVLPLSNLADNTIVEGERSLVNTLFLESKYGISNPKITDVTGHDLLGEILKSYRMGREGVVEAALRGDMEGANVAARMLKNRAIERASGSGKLVNTLQENSLEATNRAILYQRSNMVNVSGMAPIYGFSNFDDLYESDIQTVMRGISKDFMKYKVPISFQGVKDSAALSGIMSSISSRGLTAFGAYGSSTRFNFQQVSNYFNLGKNEIYNAAEDWRFGSVLTTDTGFKVTGSELPGIKTNVTYMTDTMIKKAARELGIEAEAASLTTAEGMIMVADDLKRYFNVKQTKFIEIPPEMKLSDEMLDLLKKAGGGNAFIDGYAENKKFTIAQAMKNDIVTSSVDYLDRQRARVVGQRDKNGKLLIELEQHLDAESGMKGFIGTEKGIWRFVPRNIIEQIAGKGTDVLLGAEWAKREDWNNPIAASVNYIMDRAAEGGKTNADIAGAFKQVFNMDLEYREQKTTIGSYVKNRTVAVMPDLVNPASGPMNKLQPSDILKFSELLGVDMNSQYFKGTLEARVATVARYGKAYGGKLGLDDGVRYGLRELESIRSRKIIIDGKEYGTAGGVYKWFNESIDDRAQKKFKGRYSKFITGIDTAIKSFNLDDAPEGAAIIGSRGTDPRYAMDFRQLNPIVDLQKMTREDLAGTILDPGIPNSKNGYWLQTPFDWNIEGDSTMRNKLFVMRDSVNGVDGSLYGTDIQQAIVRVDKASREFILAQDGKISPVAGQTKQELMDDIARRGSSAVNSYLSQLQKDAMGSKGRVVYNMFTAKLGNAGHFTIVGSNVFSNGSEWDVNGRAAGANTSFISEDFARRMLADSDLSSDQISDIIDVMTNGEGAFSATNRYPTFDQGAIVLGRTKISNKLEGDQAVITIGDAALMKADYDGDHLSKVMPFVDRLGKRKYSDVLAEAEANYQSIVGGKMKLTDIDDSLTRDFTEFRMFSSSDAQRSLTLGNYIKANYLKDTEYGQMRIPSLPEMQRLINETSGLDEKDRFFSSFGTRFTTPEGMMSDEFLTREARIMKAVGSASNLNAKMRRLAETLANTDYVTSTIGRAMTDATMANAAFSSILPESAWEAITTAGSINEQTGISSKHIRDLLKKRGWDLSDITAAQEENLFSTLKMFKTGLESLDVDLLKSAQENFKIMGFKDILRLGSGDITSDQISDAISMAMLPEEGGQGMIQKFLDSYRWLGMNEGDAAKKIINSVGTLNNFMSAYNFQGNAFLKYSLSNPSSPGQGVKQWNELSNPLSDQFIPTEEVRKLYSAWDREADFEEGAKLFSQRMSQSKRDTINKFIGADGDNFARFIDESRPMRTIGDDTIEKVAAKVFSNVDGGSFGSGAIGGVAAFAGLWAASAIFRNGPEEDSVELGQADTAPSSDGEYVNPAVFGPAPAGTAPTARVMPRGSGYENVNIHISASDSSGWSEAEIRDIVQQQLSGQMPMGVNMNVNSRDDTQRIDRQWVNDTLTKAIRFGYAF